MFCQLENLRYCLPPSVRRTLDELPESLDETYERVLKEIKKPNRDHARRLLQCLVVAIRPLEVKELAEILAVDFDAEGIPALKPNWRWEDEEQALLTSCSSLITTVETYHSRVVQFSHFSVKEYLTSARLATSNRDVSHYRINLEPAHTILAQACMSVLLQPDDRVEENGAGKSSPLTNYAARHWIMHAQFERVSLFLREALDYLFDLDKPYFAALVKLCDIDTDPMWGSSTLRLFAVNEKSDVTPLYYAALCGFEDLVERLAVKYPQDVNSNGGYYVTPLVAALAGRHFQTAKLLHHKGADANVCGRLGNMPLHYAASHGDLEMVRILLDCKVDVNALGGNDSTPIHEVSAGSLLPTPLNIPPPPGFPQPPHIPQSFPDVTRLLLEHGADVNARSRYGWTPLHASGAGMVEVVRVLLEHGADAFATDTIRGRTPLHSAVYHGETENVRVLLEHGADAGTKDNDGKTSLHEAAYYAHVEVVRVLLEHGVNANAEDRQGETPLHRATYNAEVVRVLIEHGAYASAEDKRGRTTLHNAAGMGRVESVRILFEHGANANAKDNQGGTPLHEAASHGGIGVVRVLLEHDADVSAKDNEGRTPLHQAAHHGTVEVVRELLEHGANASAEDNQGMAPFQIASERGADDIMELLSEYGAKGVL